MKIFENTDCEIHSLFDIKSVMLKTVEVLINKEDTKDYVIVIICKKK